MLAHTKKSGLARARGLTGVYLALIGAIERASSKQDETDHDGDRPTHTHEVTSVHATAPAHQ